MSKEEWWPGGWTCEHRKVKSFGPCENCLPGNGRCPACSKPLDDHDGLGTPDFSCRRKRQAA